MEQLFIILFTVILIIIGYVVGRIAESKHYRSIKEREHEWLHLPVVTMKNAQDAHRDISRAQLVAGNVVISIDYFKRFLAGLRNLFGGNVVSYESLIDRARREAILRMKEAAKGADIILNLRIETASISKGAKKSIGSVEALAYGTAITYKPGSSQNASSLKTQVKPPQTRPTTPSPDVRPLSSAAQEQTKTRPASPPEPLYKVVFTGEIAPGQDMRSVKAKVAALYKVPVARCESLFSGRLMTIKENLDYPTAQKYKQAFERTGAICRIEPL